MSSRASCLCGGSEMAVKGRGKAVKRQRNFGKVESYRLVSRGASAGSSPANPRLAAVVYRS